MAKKKATATQEVAVTTELQLANDGTKLTAKQEIRKKSLVNAYFKAMESLQKSAWNTAKAVNDCLKATEIFPTANSVALALGLNKATVSKLSKVYEMRESLLTTYETVGRDLTASQMQELLPVYNEDNKINDVAICIETQNITSADTSKDVREKVKAYQNRGIEKQEEPQDTEEPQEETQNTEESDDDSYYATFFCYQENTEVEMASFEDIKITKEQLEQIKAILNK